MSKYFGTDGIRGKAEMFTGEFLAKIVRGLDVRGKKVMIGGDTRESTERILGDLAESLAKCGAARIGNVGVLPTPGINYAFYALGFDLAIDVTASHNPYTDNGIKIFERGEEFGVKLGEEARERIEETIDAGDDEDLADDSLGGDSLAGEFARAEVEDLSREAREAYIEHLCEYVEKVDLSGMRICLDLANGATSMIGAKAFERLGAKVETMNEDARFGRKINDGAGSTHIEGLRERVRTGELDFGAAFDGDGDRGLMVDKNGEVVDGDQILAVIAKHLKLPKIVATVMANQGLINWGREQGVEVEITDVGDQNVAKAMRATNICLGGEQSGHIILPGEAMGDGMLTALEIARVIRESRRGLEELAGEMKKFPQAMRNVPADRAAKESLKSSERVRKIIAEAEKKLERMNGRLLVRPSGTEELVRITLWGEDQAEIEELAGELEAKLTEEFRNGRN